MKAIGLLIAVEIDSLLKSSFEYIKKECIGKFEVYHYEINGNKIFAIHSGCGQINAAAATEILISLFHVNFIINFGIVGALTEEMSLNQVCLVENVVDYSFDTSEIDNCEVGRHLEYPSIYIKSNEKLIENALKSFPDLRKVNCASGNKFVSTFDEKSRIHSSFNCDIIDMESAGIILTANMHDIGTLFIKGVSDGLNGGKDEFLAMFQKSSTVCVEVLKKLLESNI